MYKKFLSLLLAVISVLGTVRAQQPGQVQYPTSQDSPMSLFEVKDNAKTTLRVSISASATTLTVASTATFPATGSLLLDSKEIVYYTGKTLTTFTGVLRGREGTAALVHAANIGVVSPILAVHHNTLSQALRNIESKLGYSDSGTNTPAAGKVLLGTGAGQSSWETLALDNLPIAGYATSSFPTPSVAGRVIRATDGSRGIYVDTGSQWVPINKEIMPEWFGAKGDGVTNDASALNSAITASATTRYPVVLDGGTYLINSALSTSTSYVAIIGRAGAKIKGSSIFANAQGAYSHWRLEGIEFDANNAQGAVLTGANDIQFNRCKFRNFAIAVSSQDSANVIFNYCEFYGTRSGVMASGATDPAANGSATYSRGFQLNGGETNVVFENCYFHFLESGIVSGTQSTSSTNGLIVRNSRFRADWWDNPYRLYYFTPTAYNNSTKVVTVAGGGLTGRFTAGEYHTMSIPVTVSTGASSSITNFFAGGLVTSGSFGSAQYGDVIETSDGKRAMIVGVTDSTHIAIGQWEDQATFEETTLPAANASWRITRYYAATANFTSDSTITLYNEPINPYTGKRLVTDDALTLVGKNCRELSKTGYSGIHINANAENVLIEGNHLRGSWADQVSVFSSQRVRIASNTIEYTQDEGITLTSCPRAVVNGNTFRMNGVSAVFVSASDGTSITGNTIDTWGVVNRAGLGAIDGAALNLAVTGNTTRIAPGGAGSGSAYVVNLGYAASSAGTIINGNTDGGARTATLNISTEAGSVTARDLLSVAGAGATNVNALSSADNASINSLTLPFDGSAVGNALKFKDGAGNLLAKMWSGAGGDGVLNLKFGSGDSFDWLNSDNSTALRWQDGGAFGFGTPSPFGRLHMTTQGTGNRGLIVQGIASQVASTFWSIDSSANIGLTILNNRVRLYNGTTGTMFGTDETGSGTEYLQLSPVSNVYTFASTANGAGTARPFAFTGGSVAIGAASPAASALLELSGTTKGFLPPRMTTTERDAISSPAAGLVIYNTTTNALNVYTTSWGAIGGSSGATQALDNLASVNINTSFIPQTGVNLGAQATPFKELWLYGNGTFGSHSLKFTGTPTGHRTLTFPDATDTVAVLGTAQTWTAAQTYGSGLLLATAPVFTTSISTPSIITASGALTITPNSNANILLNTTGLIQIGGTTSSFPAFKRSTTEVQFRLADDSGYATARLQGINIENSLVAANITTEGGTADIKMPSGGLIINGPFRFFNGATYTPGFSAGAAGVVKIENGIGVGGTFSAVATTPAQITANQNDYNPGGVSYLQRWSTDASRNVTGLTFTGTKQAGQTHLICNVGSQNIVLTHDDGSTSTAANRFKFVSGTNVTIAPDDCVTIIYDATTARWRRAQ